MKVDLNYVIISILCILLFFVIKLDRKLTVCPVTGDIPCKCNKKQKVCPFTGEIPCNCNKY